MPATKDIEDRVILVDDQDVETGTAEKLEAHQKGLRHRAFSIFILRNASPGVPEILLQKRAAGKYHSPNLWTNTCCSHPAPGENLLQAAKRRLQEELRLMAPELKDIGQFHYIAHFENGLIENEVDHVIVGWYDKEVFTLNPAEVQACRWVLISDLHQELLERPQEFTAWLQPALQVLEAAL